MIEITKGGCASLFFSGALFERAVFHYDPIAALLAVGCFLAAVFTMRKLNTWKP